MNERIHEHLDEGASGEGLTPEEKRELDEYVALIQRVTRLHHGEPYPDLTGPVMSRIADRRPAASIGTRAQAHVGGTLAWLWRPHSVRLRPAYGLGLVGIAAIAVLAMPWPPTSSTGPMEGTTAANPSASVQVYVQFRLDAPGASTVRLAGSFTGWEPQHQLHEAAPGVWTILIPLAPGVHEYAFVVDESDWRSDPAAPRIDDGFGGQNSRVAVILPAYPTS